MSILHDLVRSHILSGSDCARRRTKAISSRTAVKPYCKQIAAGITLVVQRLSKKANCESATMGFTLLRQIKINLSCLQSHLWLKPQTKTAAAGDHKPTTTFMPEHCVKHQEIAVCQWRCLTIPSFEEIRRTE